MEKSIYELIKEAIGPDGRLPEGFRLPPDIAPDEEPGETRGLIAYRYANGNDDPEDPDFKKLVRIIDSAEDGRVKEAEELLLAYAAEPDDSSFYHNFIWNAEFLNDYIYDNRFRFPDELEEDPLFNWVVRLAQTSRCLFAVQFSISVLAVYIDSREEPFRSIIRTLGLYDDFALDVSSVMANWPDADEELFAAAKKVNGWGRTHFIRRIKNPTAEMKEWLLYHGMKNRISPDYSAYFVYKKTDYIRRLLHSPGRKEFIALRSVLNVLLTAKRFDRDIEYLPYYERIDLCYQFVNAAERQSVLNSKDIAALLRLYDYMFTDSDFFPAYNRPLDQLEVLIPLHLEKLPEEKKSHELKKLVSDLVFYWDYDFLKPFV